MGSGPREPARFTLVAGRLGGRPQHQFCQAHQVRQALSRTAGNVRAGNCRRPFAPASWAASLAASPLARIRLCRVSCWTSAAILLYRVNASCGRHPRKEVEGALRDAQRAGWTVTPKSSGHRCGVMRCGESSRSGCQVSIWSTPRNCWAHAGQLRRFLGRCLHKPLPQGRRS